MNAEIGLIAGIAAKLLVVGAILWLAYLVVMKGLVFLRALTRPARRAVRGALDPLERKAANHVADALEEAGLSSAARNARRLPDVASAAESAIGRHLDKHSTRKE